MTFRTSRRPQTWAVAWAVAWVVALAALVLSTANEARAQLSPTGTIRLLVPYSAGGSIDVSARLLAEGMSNALNQRVIVENKPGANGRIAMEEVARATPDGRTLLFAGAPQLILLPLLDKSLTRDVRKSFKMIAIASEYHLVLVTGKNNAITSVQDLVKKIQAKPNDVTFSTVGVSALTPIGLASLVFVPMVNGTAKEVPYQGTSQAVPDLLAGRITFSFSTATFAEEQKDNINVLAVATRKRLGSLPNTPTFAEAGFPEFETVDWSSWSSVVAPAGVSDEAANQLAAAIAKAYADPGVLKKLAVYGLDSMAGKTSSEYQKIWDDTYARYANLLERYKIQLP